VNLFIHLQIVMEGGYYIRKQGDFFVPFAHTLFNTASSAAVSEDAKIEPRTVATLALAVQTV
jgi:hypothetical protein